MRDNLPPDWVDAPWWEVMSAPLRAERLSGEAWIDQLALAWCLVRRPESLTAKQLATQVDMVDRLLRRKFLTTVPGWVSLR